MDDEHLAAARGDRADEIADEAVVLVAVDPQPVLDGDGNRDGVAHRPDAIRDQRGLGHQARAEAPHLHALGRAADVEVDLVVAPALAQLRAGRERRRIAAAQLQRDRMLGRIEVEMPRDVAVQQRAGRDHLGVEPRVPRDEAQEVPAVPVGPVEHRGDAEAVRRAPCARFACAGKAPFRAARLHRSPILSRAARHPGGRSPESGRSVRSCPGAPPRTARAARASASCPPRCAGSRRRSRRARAAGTSPRRAR